MDKKEALHLQSTDQLISKCVILPASFPSEYLNTSRFPLNTLDAFPENTVKVDVNPEILENKERRNFWTITVMYIQVYIFGMEMSQRIDFWYQISLKMSNFWQNVKKSYFW